MNIHKIVLDQMKAELWRQDYLYWERAQTHEFDIVDKILDDMPLFDYSDAYIDNCYEEIEQEINDILSSAQWDEFIHEYLREKNDAYQIKHYPIQFYNGQPKQI